MKYLFLSLCLGLLSCSLYAQIDTESKDDQRQMRGERFEAIRVAFITSELNLTEKESQAFWPIYNEYTTKQKAFRKRTSGRRNLETMTDAEVEQVLEEYVKVQAEKAVLYEQTIKKLKPIIGSRRILLLDRSEEKLKRKILDRAGSKRDDQRKSKIRNRR